MKQKTQITFEQEETLVFKQKGAHVLEFCPQCDREVLFITPEVVAALGGSSEREIFRLVEAGAINFVEKQRTYVCSECCQRVFMQADVTGTLRGVKGEMT